jgi:chemotaxis protein CheD
MNSPSPSPSPAPKHFSHIQRRFDARVDAVVATLHPGDYYVAATDGELIGTVLGSCVSACIRDSRLRIGGMNHFMLPVDRSDGSGAGAAPPAPRRDSATSPWSG